MRAQAGFTLTELVMVMALVGILSTYALMKSGSSAVYSLPSQAAALSRDLRHVQALAMTSGRRLRVTATAGANGTYTVTCVTAGSPPCNTSPVVDPATGAAFSIALQQGVVLAGPATLDFDSQGKPSTAGSYTLTSGSATKAVSVAAVTGHVSVAP